MFPVSRQKYDDAVNEKEKLLEENQQLQESMKNLVKNVEDADLQIQQLTQQNVELQRQIDENETLNQALHELEQAQQKIQDLQNARDAEQVEHQNQIQSLNEQVRLLNEELALRPGTKPVQVLTGQDPDTEQTDGVDWETLNNLPHMKNALNH